MNKPPIPMARAVRLGLATAAASKSLLAASFFWIVVLAGVYAADAGPPLSALAFTAAALLPISAWATAGYLSATNADLRQVATAANGSVRVLVADALTPIAWVLVAAAAAVIANAVLDPHPAPLSTRLFGGLLHLVCASVGVGLALALHAGRTTRGVQALLIVAATLPSARLRWLPPAGPILSTWGSAKPSGWGSTMWALIGPIAISTGLLAITLRLRRRR